MQMRERSLRPPRPVAGWCIVGILGILGFLSVPLGGQEQPPAPDPQEVEELREQLEAAERERLELRLRIEALEGDPSPGEPETAGPLDFGLFPFGDRVRLGGYIDLEYSDPEGRNPSFRQHRFVPQLDARIDDRLRVAAEIEFEDGGSDAAADDGESKVEFAVIDYTLADPVTVRAGAILVPLGRFNLYHDSPLNDFTSRPLVDRTVIPTTLTDAGIGALGDFELGEEGELSYEVYLVNGFIGLESDPGSPTGFSSEFDESSGLRGGRPSLKLDGSGGIAGVGRVAWSPTLGVVLAASGHVGDYDEDGDQSLVITAGDVFVDGAAVASWLAGTELRAEIANAEISRDSLARASGVPGDMWGYTAEVAHHFFPESWREAVSLFGEETTFTAAVRWDHIELGSERTERLTFGLNFRPIEATVFKFDYELHFEDYSHDRIENDVLLFSVATYF